MNFCQRIPKWTHLNSDKLTRLLSCPVVVTSLQINFICKTSVTIRHSPRGLYWKPGPDPQASNTGRKSLPFNMEKPWAGPGSFMLGGDPPLLMTSWVKEEGKGRKVKRVGNGQKEERSRRICHKRKDICHGLLSVNKVLKLGGSVGPEVSVQLWSQWYLWGERGGSILTWINTFGEWLNNLCFWKVLLCYQPDYVSSCFAERAELWIYSTVTFIRVLDLMAAPFFSSRVCVGGCVHPGVYERSWSAWMFSVKEFNLWPQRKVFFIHQ